MSYELDSRFSAISKSSKISPPILKSHDTAEKRDYSIIDGLENLAVNNVCQILLTTILRKENMCSVKWKVTYSLNVQAPN